MITLFEPGDHGNVHAGIHGIGVRTPPALAVAAETVGLLMLLHIPNVIGSFGISIMVATGNTPLTTVVCDVTINGTCAAPKEH